MFNKNGSFQQFFNMFIVWYVQCSFEGSQIYIHTDPQCVCICFDEKPRLNDKKKKKLERNGKWRKIEIDSKHSQCLQIDWSGGWNISKKQLKLHETKRHGTVKRTAKQTHSEQWETYGGMKNYTKITLTIYKTRFRVNERGGRGEKNELSFARICENKCHTQSQNEKQSTIIAHSTANLRFVYE